MKDVDEEIRKAGTKRLLLEHRHGLWFNESVEHNLAVLRQFREMCHMCPEDGAGLLFEDGVEHPVFNIKPITDLRAVAESITAEVRRRGQSLA